MLWFHSGVLAANALAVSKVFAVIVAANTFALGVGAVYCMLIVLLTSDMAEIAIYATTAYVVTFPIALAPTMLLNFAKKK